MNKQQRLSSSTEKASIASFISNLTKRDYAKANQYLRSIIENKLLRKINNSTNKPIF